MILCSKCGNDSQVLESRDMVYESELTRRRWRRCKTCNYRWATVEIHLPPIKERAGVEKRNAPKHP